MIRRCKLYQSFSLAVLLRFKRLIFCLLFCSNRAKNINVDTGVIVFDDIKDCDVNVTYDLIDGEFPPPNISGKAFKMIIKVHIF